MNNKPQKIRFSAAITTPSYQNLIKNALQDTDRARRFVASITSAVAVNPELQDCEPSSIIAGALLGESLNLSPSPQLGQYYLVPFKVTAKDSNGKSIYDAGQPVKIKKAQFVLGYKGYIQLAVRSGQYKKLNVMEIKEGELDGFDALNEEIKCTLIDDWGAREKAETIGYYAMFEYINGFRKAVYWSREKMENYADKNSSAFSIESYRKLKAGEIPEKDMWKYSSFWYKSFDDMAKKTMLRQLISKWGIMSIEMQNAIESDNEFAAVDKSGIKAEREEPVYIFGEEESSGKTPDEKPEKISFDEI